MTSNIIPVKFGHQHLAFSKPVHHKPKSLSRLTLEYIAISLAFVVGIIIGGIL